jgi:hypothetical protein
MGFPHRLHLGALAFDALPLPDALDTTLTSGGPGVAARSTLLGGCDENPRHRVWVWA